MRTGFYILLLLVYLLGVTLAVLGPVSVAYDHDEPTWKRLLYALVTFLIGNMLAVSSYLVYGLVR